jgi:hypothetical protein
MQVDKHMLYFVLGSTYTPNAMMVSPVILGPSQHEQHSKLQLQWLPVIDRVLPLATTHHAQLLFRSHNLVVKPLKLSACIRITTMQRATQQISIHKETVISN